LPTEIESIIERLAAMSEDDLKAAIGNAHSIVGQKRWVPNIGPQTEAYFSKADELFYGGQAGGGKLLAAKGVVLTPFGFRANESLKIGDAVNAPDGSVARIIQLHPWVTLPGVKVSFHDGTSTTVAWDHLWLAWRSGEAKKCSNERLFGPDSAQVIETRELRLWLDKAKEQQGRGIRPKWPCIPLCEPQRFNVTRRYKIDIDPYQLGFWLGDGHISSKNAIGFTSVDHAHMAEYFSECSHKEGDKRYGLVSDKRKTFLAGLTRAGLEETKAATKFIPDEYIWGSLDVRLAVLQGLMDTDGTVDERGQLYFTSISKRLAEGLRTIVQSLGGTATLFDKPEPFYTDADGNKVVCQDAFNLYIKLPNSIAPFRLERKLARCNDAAPRYRRVVSVEETEIVKGRCITVSHPSGLYMTNDFIVTHNSDLVVGTALEEHTKSLILRRFGADADGLADRAMTILGSRDGWHGQKSKLRLIDNQVIDFGGCKDEQDKERYKGEPHDLISFDEIGDFVESQYRFIIGWNRSVIKGQRCRVICTGNPPTTAEGLWVIKYWGAWLDPGHPNPAQDGELRWYTTLSGKDTEVPNGDPIPEPDKPGKFITPKSRTFIRSTLDDNPDLSATNYDSVLAAMPEGLREAYREGKFDLGLKDKDGQMIPTAWVRAAFDRWTTDPPRGIPMCTIAADIAQGGIDNTVIQSRHDGWFAKASIIPGAATPDGPSVAAAIMSRRRHNAEIVLDMGGGFGGSAYDHLKDNGLKIFKFNGAMKSVRSSKNRALRFTNRRTEAYWKLREALDPGQFQGSPLSLPPSQELLADLTTPTVETGPAGIKMMSKKDVKSLLGRSPDRGDAVVMCWYAGPTAATHYQEWRSDQGTGTVGRRRTPKVNMGRHHQQERRRK